MLFVGEIKNNKINKLIKMEIDFDKKGKIIKINDWVIKDPELIEVALDFDDDIEKLKIYIICLFY